MVAKSPVPRCRIGTLLIPAPIAESGGQGDADRLAGVNVPEPWTVDMPEGMSTHLACPRLTGVFPSIAANGVISKNAYRGEK